MLISFLSNFLRLSEESLSSFWEWLNKSCITSLVIKEFLILSITFLRCKCEWILSFSLKCWVE